MMHRRRFLTLSAACSAMPAFAAAPTRWSGFAMGAEVSLELHGPVEQTEPALRSAIQNLRRVEHLFSLYDPTSVLSQLNRTGVLRNPPQDLLDLLAISDQIHTVTGGLFDPTVQAFWHARVDRHPLQDARALVDWQKIQFDADVIRLGAGQSLTFNGIAQGYATDLVTADLVAHGLGNIHVNLGEHAVRGPARTLGVQDPEFGVLGHVTLQGKAIATSSPAATRIGDTAHIFSPTGGDSHWSTVSVMDASATWADGLSTAFCLASLTDIKRVHSQLNLERVLLVDRTGDITTF